MSHDLDRLQRVYASREQQVQLKAYYSLTNPANLFIYQRRQRAMVELLKLTDHVPLSGQRILEVGCGNGNVLADMALYGAQPNLLYGIDLLPYRLRNARNRLPNSYFSCGNGQSIPFPSNSFDIVLQFTAFSSILDSAIRMQVAEDMLRVLNKPNGIILWYDFWINPGNSQVRGIRPGEIRRLFPDCEFAIRRITLAPPLSRRLVPFSWLLAEFMESLRILNTHYIVAIRRPG